MKEKQINVFGDVTYVAREAGDEPERPRALCRYFEAHTQLCTHCGFPGYLLHCRGSVSCGEYEQQK
jgi:hypothetical protein